MKDKLLNGAATAAKVAVTAVGTGVEWAGYAITDIGKWVKTVDTRRERDDRDQEQIDKLEVDND